MNLNALGYVGIRTRNLEDWASYGTRFLGMQLVGQSRGTLALRMDDRKQRIIVHTDEDDGPSFYGWEVADTAALDALAAHLEKSGVKVARGSRALADERRVKDLIRFRDPAGNTLEKANLGWATVMSPDLSPEKRGVATVTEQLHLNYTEPEPDAQLLTRMWRDGGVGLKLSAGIALSFACVAVVTAVF